MWGSNIRTDIKNSLVIGISCHFLITRLLYNFQIIAGFEDKLDTDTLTKIMDDPDWVDSYGTYIPDYQSEIDSILTEETDKYLLGSQSLDDTIKNLMDRGNEVIEENK